MSLLYIECASNSHDSIVRKCLFVKSMIICMCAVTNHVCEYVHVNIAKCINIEYIKCKRATFRMQKVVKFIFAAVIDTSMHGMCHSNWINSKNSLQQCMLDARVCVHTQMCGRLVLRFSELTLRKINIYLTNAEINLGHGKKISASQQPRGKTYTANSSVVKANWLWVCAFGT